MGGVAPGVRFAPTGGFSGTDSFTFTATNADGESLPARASVTVVALPAGGLTQRPEGEDCLATQPIDGLETIPNCVSDLHGTRGASAIAASPDGEHVYVAGSLTADPLATPDPASHNVAVLRRADNGALTQASGTEACVSREASVGCAEDAMLGRPSDLAMSPDGRHVYVASNDSGTSSILTYSRDAVTGALTRTSCVSGAAPCLDQVRALDDVRAIALSPDGNARSAAS